MMSASFVRWKFSRMLAVGTLTMAVNARRVLCEYFVSVGGEGEVRIVVRDNGKALPNGRGTYLNTLGCNRTDYRFVSKEK